MSKSPVGTSWEDNSRLGSPHTTTTTLGRGQQPNVKRVIPSPGPFNGDRRPLRADGADGRSSAGYSSRASLLAWDGCPSLRERHRYDRRELAKKKKKSRARNYVNVEAESRRAAGRSPRRSVGSAGGSLLSLSTARYFLPTTAAAAAGGGGGVALKPIRAVKEAGLEKWRGHLETGRFLINIFLRHRSAERLTSEEKMRRIKKEWKKNIFESPRENARAGHLRMVFLPKSDKPPVKII